jgi:O-succinylbenzoate synthase
MKIERLEVFHVALPLATPFRTAYDDGARAIESVLVRLESEGIVGWGEATPWGEPFYSSEWAAGVFDLCRRVLGPRLLGCTMQSGAELQDVLAPVKGNPFAKAAFDLAWWDWKARSEKLPLWKLLGGSTPVVAVGADFGVTDTIEELLKSIETALEAGYPRVKLKMRRGWDVDVMRQVRRTFPDATFHVDANSSYSLEEASTFLALDELHLAMIEQPLAYDDLLDHAKLARQLQTPICLDESINSVRRARQAIEIGACSWFNIKPGRVGGLTPALEIMKLARENGIPFWIGSMLESGIGAAFLIALATQPGCAYPSDIFPSTRFWARDLSDQEIKLCAPGQIAAFEGDGIGCAPEPQQLRAMTLQRCTL